jgi:hypothetical protein
MVDKLDYSELNGLILEYLENQGMSDAAEAFQSDQRKKAGQSNQLGGASVIRQPANEAELRQFPELYQRFVEDKIIEGAELREGKMVGRTGNPANFVANEGDLKQLQRQHSSVLQSGR